MRFFVISKNLSEKMIYKSQSCMAKMSCEIIKTIAFNLNISENTCPNLVSALLCDDDGRMVYPCFFFSKILFAHMQKTKCTVLIVLETIDNNHNHKDLILFNNGDNQGHLLMKNNKPTKEELCIVFICTRTVTTPLSTPALLKNLNSFGLYDILLMNMAAHPQFSGSKLIYFANQLVPDATKLTAAEKKIEEEFLILKSRAHKYGFCLDNPSRLLIKHIFMDTIKNQIDFYQNNHYISVRETVDI